MRQPNICFMEESRSLLETRYGPLRLLGSGDESCVFTDDRKVYKIFRNDHEYYSYIGKQLAGRFSGCKHLYDIETDSIGDYSVFIYDFEPSRSYAGGMEDQMVETMAEFALNGVVCIDIKPNNFRISEGNLRFIDYGHDIVPFTESGFINMCLNSFLCIKYWAEPQFINFSQITRYTWDEKRTEGFIDFFNTIYKLYNETKDQHHCPSFKIPNNRWIERVINDYSNERTLVLCLTDMSDQLFHCPVCSADIISDKGELIIISKIVDDVLLSKLKKLVHNGGQVYLITTNPLFKGNFDDFKNRLESNGLFFTILAHSDPVPCKEGLESEFILVKLSKEPTESNSEELSKRNEDYIFVICGRNVSPQCYLRCWHSLEKQRCGRWGAIIIDDASNNDDIDYLIRSTACAHKRVTYIRNNERKSILPNILHSIKDVCSNPNSVIITLDMDDALLSDDALCILRSEYMRGHDVVSSTCLKKGVRILPYEIRFDDARGEKVGDVWMHLRSFRKYLFDAIDESDFMDNGEWIEIFNELTFMVPISEMALNPVQVRAPLYLWEPRTPDDEHHRIADQHTKSLIRSRKSYAKYHLPRIIGEIRPPGMLVLEYCDGDILIIRHAEKEDRKDYLSTERGITERGEREASLFGKCLKKIDVYLCSEIRRTAETAYCMNKGNGGEFNIIVDPVLNAISYDYSIWCGLKDKYGYLGILKAWREGELEEGTLPDFRDYSVMFLEKVLELSENKSVCIVTHDHMVCILSTIFTECNDSRVPYMGGFVLKKNDILNRLKELKKLH